MTKYAIGRHPAGPMETVAQRILDAERRERERIKKEQEKNKNKDDLTIEGKPVAFGDTETTAADDLKIDPPQPEGPYAINRNPEGPMETLVDRIRQQEERRRRRSGRKGGTKDSGTGKGAGGPNTGSGGSGSGEANL